jgi:protoporphyrinogen/coproporphyrinogen III oxidase
MIVEFINQPSVQAYAAMTVGDRSSAPPRIAVVGGGISGLAAAHRLTEVLPQAELVLFESANRLGGVLETVRRDGFLVEHSADSFITKYPWATELCRRIGFEDQLLPTDESRRRALVVSGDELLRVPAAFVLMTANKPWSIVTTPILSWRGRLRVLLEPWMPRRPASELGDESVGAFATRRLGREAYERLVQPLLGGIHTADADRLSLAATFPEYMAQEQYFGCIQPNAKQPSESGARYGMFVAPRDGVSSLVDTIAGRLPPGTVRLNTPVAALEHESSDRWRVVLGEGKAEPFDAVIVALPAPAAAKLLATPDGELSAELAAIEYASCAIVCVAYRRDQFGRPPDGFGFVVPRIEQRPIIAGSFASEKFPGRAPDGEVLIRVFIGGAQAPELVEQSDEELQRIAHDELAKLMHVTGSPLWSEVVRWRASMPQYHVGHLQRIAQIESRVTALGGLELAGNAYHGVGIPQCIHSGEAAADRVAKEVTGGRCSC